MRKNERASERGKSGVDGRNADMEAEKKRKKETKF